MQTIPSAVSGSVRPLVSFIVTYYNRPVQDLRRCIGSILALELDNRRREIILVDDGSEASPMPALADWASFLTYLRKPNGGLSDARNAGIRQARGEYIQFVDDDDCLLPRNYAHCVELARMRAFDLVLFQSLTEGRDGQTDMADTRYESGAAYMYARSVRPAACGYLFRREALGDLRFTYGIYHEDEEFTSLLLLRVGMMVETTAAAYHYRIHPGSIVTRSDAESVRKRLRDTCYVIDSLRTVSRGLEGLPRQALRRRIDQLAAAYLYNAIVWTRSVRRIREAFAVLRERGLYPLPAGRYSRRYNWFRRVANAPLGWLPLLLFMPRRPG